MGLLDLIRGRANVGASSAIVLDPTALAIGQHHVPANIRDLLWFSDGPLRNYVQRPESESTSSFEGIRMTVSFFGTSEPSAISIGLPVGTPSGTHGVEPLGYYPSYEGMTPRQRWVYLNWLMDIDGSVDIGYVFVFYYGLERQLFGPLADQAVDTILRLRAHHTHSSFVRYSSDAVLAASLVANRSDWLLKFAETINLTGDAALSDIYLYAKYLYGFELSPVELMAMSGRVGFTNRRYIQNQTSLFEAALQDAIRAKLGADGVSLARYSVADCQPSQHALFANYSLDRDRVLLAVPVFAEHPEFRSTAFDLLQSAHETVKQQLKFTRAAAKSTSTGEAH